MTAWITESSWTASIALPQPQPPAHGKETGTGAVEPTARRMAKDPPSPCRSGGPSTKGYQGHSNCRVVEACMLHSFPVDKARDSNAKPTGGKQQICCKPENGEASWIVRRAQVYQFLQ